MDGVGTTYMPHIHRMYGRFTYMNGEERCGRHVGNYSIKHVQHMGIGWFVRGFLSSKRIGVISIFISSTTSCCFTVHLDSEIMV